MWHERFMHCTQSAVTCLQHPLLWLRWHHSLQFPSCFSAVSSSRFAELSLHMQLTSYTECLYSVRKISSVPAATYYLYLDVSNAYFQPWPVLGSPAPCIPRRTCTCPFIYSLRLKTELLSFPSLQHPYRHLQSCTPQILGVVFYTILSLTFHNQIHMILLTHFLNPFAAPYVLPQPWSKHPYTLPWLSPEFLTGLLTPNLTSPSSILYAVQTIVDIHVLKPPNDFPRALEKKTGILNVIHKYSELSDPCLPL